MGLGVTQCQTLGREALHLAWILSEAGGGFSFDAAVWGCCSASRRVDRGWGSQPTEARRLWSLNQFFPVGFLHSRICVKSVFYTNKQSKFTSGVYNGFCAKCSKPEDVFISAFLEATYEARLRTLEDCRVSSKSPSRVQDGEGVAGRKEREQPAPRSLIWPTGKAMIFFLQKANKTKFRFVTIYLTDVDIVDNLHSSAVGAGRGLQRHLPCKKRNNQHSHRLSNL